MTAKDASQSSLSLGVLRGSSNRLVCTYEGCTHTSHFSNAGALAQHESTHGVVN